MSIKSTCEQREKIDYCKKYCVMYGTKIVMSWKKRLTPFHMNHFDLIADNILMRLIVIHNARKNSKQIL